MFWSSETVFERHQKDPIILPVEQFDKARLVRGSYELRVGHQAHITSETGRTVDLKTGDRVVIPPGQFGILITKEHVNVPVDAIGFISIKASEKFKGLVNVSGFHVDPGFNGPLKFAVYNAGPKPVELDQGKPVFLIWFAQLDRTESPYPNEQRPNRLRITDEDVEKIQGDIASPGALKVQFDGLQEKINERLRPVEFHQKVVTLVFGRVVLVVVSLIVGGLLVSLFPPVLNRVIARFSHVDVKDNDQPIAKEPSPKN